MNNIQINWLDGRKSCYWPGLENKNYSFYRRVKRSNIEYEVGSGVYVPGLHPKIKDIARIHCLYENGDTVKVSDRYRAIIEIFLSPKRYEKLAKENNIVLHNDIEVIADGKAKFYNISIESLLGKCHIVYSMSDEDPEIVLLKHFKKHTEPTYICRLKLDKNGNVPVFSCVITNEIVKNETKKIDSDDDDCILIEDERPKVKNYKVTAVECNKNENSVKLKLARQSLTEIKQPIVLLDTINLDNYTKSPKAKKIDENSKENVNVNNENLLKSRRKQNHEKKMYGDENIELENVVNKIKNIGIVTPKKNTPQRRTRTTSVNSVENEPVRKTPKKSKTIEKTNKNLFETAQTSVTPKKTKRNTNNDESDEPLKKTPKKNDNIEVDAIVDRIKSRLSIVTPQKTKTPTKTPVRRRLESLNEEEISKTPLRKSTRISACTKNLALDINSDSDEDKKTTRSQRKSVKNTPKSKIFDLSDCEDKKSRSTRKSLRNTKKSDAESEDEGYEVIKNRRKSTRMSNVKSTPKTPSRIKVSNLAHEVQARSGSLHVGGDALEVARAMLRNTMKNDEKTVAGSLPCREKEYEDIVTFVEGKLSDRAGGCMYISGVPGTGKTATVNRVIASLKHEYDFKNIIVNALSLTEPKQVYVEIMKQLKGVICHWDSALEQIRSYFMNTKRETHLLVIDELDKLCTRKQDVVYNLLDLPANSRTPLIVIAIANTMDLPERLLSNKVNSRLGLTRVSFRPYKFGELADIVRRRLGANKDAFRNEAIEFVARKVAAVSGDARRAIAICARATELAESLNSKDVTMDIVNKTLADAAGTNAARAVRALSFAQKVILKAIAHEVQRTGNDEVSFSDVVRVANEFCVLDGVNAFSSGHLLMACQTLRAMRLIIGQEGQKDTAGTILLNISPDDVHFALKND